MKQKTLEQNIADLPKWAQHEVSVLQMRLRESKDELYRIKENPQSNTIAGYSSRPIRGEQIHYLGNNQPITFVFGSDNEEEVTARITKEGCLEIRSSGFGGLFVRPQASNVVQIHLIKK